MPTHKFTQELFDSICSEISTSNRGLVSICKDKSLNAKTFYDWIKEDSDLSNKYARAKELQAEYLAEEIILIADDSSRDTIIHEETGTESFNSEFAARSRLRVDARKWIASKLYPKKYGEKVQNEVTVDTSIAQIIVKQASDKKADEFNTGLH